MFVLLFIMKLPNLLNSFIAQLLTFTIRLYEITLLIINISNESTIVFSRYKNNIFLINIITAII